MSQGGIARWVDRSGNARHLIQSSPSGRPDLDVVGWNGNKPTVKFNGSEFLAVETWSGSPAGTNAGLTVLAVMRSGDARDAAVAAWWNESGDGALAGVRAVGGLTLLDFMRLDDLTTSQILAGDRDLGSGRHAVVWRFAPSTQTVTLTVDGAHNATSYEAPLGELLPAPLVVGAATPLGVGSFLGEISELVIVGADISDENVQGFTSYAKKRWGGLPAPSPGGLCRKADREPTPVGISCDDGDPDTIGDQCAFGSCAGLASSEVKPIAENLRAAEEPGASEVLELPSGWTPGDLAPAAWYYADLQYVTTAADGVSAWADRSGNGHHVVQVASGYRPQFQPAGWNGNRPTLAFNGTTAFLRDNGWASGSPVGSEEPFTVLAVVEPTAIQRGGIASWYGTYGGGWIATRLVTPDGISLFGEIRRQGTDHLYWVGNDTYTFTGSTNVGTGRHVLVYRFSNGRLKITVDAGTDAEQTPHAPLSPLGGTEFLIGREDTFYANDYAGKLSELVVVPRELTDADVQTFREYARKQWGGLIGPNHARGESAGKPPPSMPRPAPYVGPVVGDDNGAALLDEFMATLTASEVEILRSGEPLAWDVEEVAESPPPLPYDTRLCANWNASYVDGDLGEDDGGTPAPDGAPFKRYPASYARFRLLTFGPLAPPQVEHNWLDADGCWTIDPARLTFDPAAEPGTQGSLTLVMVLEANDLPGFGPGFFRPDDEFENDADEVGMAYSIAGDGAWLPRAAFGTDVPGSVPFETWTQAGIWAQPPEVVDLRAPAEFMNPIQNIAATVSTLLTTPDLGLVPFQYQISQGTGTFFHDAFGNFVYESSGGDPVRFAPPQPARNLDECSLSDAACPDTTQTCIDLVTRQACASETGCGCFPSTFEATIPNSACLSGTDCAATQDCFRDNAAFAAICGGTSCLLTPCDGAQGCRCMTTCETDLNCQPDEGCFDATSFGPCLDGPCLCMKQDNTRWKMILAHELGHQVQHLGIGPGDLSGDNSYQFCSDAMCSNKINDPPGIATESPLCACNHVRAANATHCLQSIETTGDAQTEGFAQFFAARVWNDATEPDCAFVYYKEFLGADGITQPPPVALDCASPHKWRNSHCNMAENADMATELDWLGFLYNLNSLGPEATQVPMTDLWKIYRNACVPPGTSPNPDPPACMNNIPMQWQLTGIASDPPRACSATVACAPSTFTCLDASPGSMVPCPANGTCVCKVIRQGFVEGARGTFGAGSEDANRVEVLGLTFGVDRNLAP